MHGLGKSNDVGLSLIGKFNDSGNLGYHFMIGNGTAQKLENDKFKKFYGDVYAWVLNKKVFIDLYGDYERSQLAPYQKSKTTYKATVAYQTAPFTIGVEAGQQVQQNYGINLSTPSDSLNDVVPLGISIFTRGNIIKEKLNFYARYDMFQQDSKYSASETVKGSSSLNENFLVAGVDWTPSKNVHIMPNVWYNGIENKAAGATGLLKSDYDLVPRVTFYYVYGK